MKRKLPFILLFSIFGILSSCPAAGQTTHNLNIIWQKASPDHVTSGAVPYWGFNMAGGDLNGDGFSDFVSSTDSVLDAFGWLQWKIYIFNGGTSLSTVPSQVITYDTAGGHPTMCIADFNGDGYGDLALGDSYGTGDNQAKGQVLIHYGTGVDLNTAPDLVIGGYGSATATAFGTALTSGDINEDGIADLVVGAPSYPISADREGIIFIYYGDTLGLHIWPDMIIRGHSSPVNYEEFGYSVDAGEDINKDGYDDIIACGYLNSETNIASGKIYYYLSDNTPIDTIADGWFYGQASHQRLGVYNVSSVATDSMGVESMGWFGTPDWPSATGSFGEGKCYMVPGDTIGETPPEWTITGEDTGLGFWSSSAGYADGDKIGDLLAGASPALNRTGRAYLWLRRPIMKDQYDAYIQGRHDGSSGIGDVLGARVAPAGDVDGCGRDEFMVSNYYADTDNMIWLCKYTGPDGVTGEPEFKIQNSKFKMYQNTPNPFSHQTTIKYQVAKAGKVSLKVYNIQGQLVKTLVDQTNGNPLRNGEGREGSVTWDGRDDRGQNVSNGIYIYQLNAGGESGVKKMTYLR